MSRKLYGFTALLAAGLLAATLVGCGSDKKESSAGIDGNVAKVGDEKCFQCHSATLDPVTGESIVVQYAKSTHYAEGIGCESCHGGGAMHNGVGPLPFPDPGASRCATCHNGTDAPLSSSPNFQNGNHANMFSAEEAHEPKCARCHSHEGALLYGRTAGYTGDQSIMNNTAYQPVLEKDPETFRTIQCATCHQHGGALRQSTTRDRNTGAIVAWDPNRNFKNDQYDLCTSCHTLTTNEGKLIGSGNTLSVANTAGGFSNISTAAYYHNTAWYRTIPTTHYDQPASGTTAAGTTIEGYIIRKTSANPCYDCHGHEFQTNTRRLDPAATATIKARPNTIYLDWAQSAHAGRLLTQKIAAAAGAANRTTAQVDAVMKAGATDATGVGWTHYNWDDSTGTSSDRKNCQRCHTATGASNFLNDPVNYNPANNSFTHLAGWTTANKKSDQQELLYCWGCHSNAGTGKLRNPGAIQHKYSAATYPKYTIQYPDIAGSNVCIACHTGRETGDSIKNHRDADGVLTFVNSHYLTAGGTLFGTTGYEFAGLSYANPSYFGHDKIGSSAAPGTGSNGPCAGCHMTSANPHSFLPVTKDATGAITAITSTACANCHTGQYALTPAILTTEEEEYVAALEAAKAALASKGVHFGEAYPYFFTAPYVAGGTNTGFTNWAGVYGFASWKDTMGAAFNANLLIHDPGGYAHNRFYAKRLIWDSIDFITDGTIGNVTSMNAVIDALGLPAATATAAKDYLGNTRP